MSVEGATRATQNHPDRDGIEGGVASPAIQSGAGHPLGTPQPGGWLCPQWCGASGGAGAGAGHSSPLSCLPSPPDGLSGPGITGPAGTPGAAGTPLSDGAAGAGFGSTSRVVTRPDIL